MRREEEANQMPTSVRRVNERNAVYYPENPPPSPSYFCFARNTPNSRNNMLREHNQNANIRKKRSQPIDFRQENDWRLKKLYAQLHAKEKQEYIVHTLIQLKQEKNDDDYFAQFLQHLFYYLPHNINDKHYVSDTLLMLLNRFEIDFFKAQCGGQIWIDPKEGSTTLHSVSRSGYFVVARVLLAITEVVFGGKKSSGFRNFLRHANKDQFSPLNSAACAGHYEMVALLLAEAAVAFSGKQSETFKNFLEKKNKHGLTSLNLAATTGLFAKNYNKKKQYREICRLLLDNGANPDIHNRKGFTARSNWCTVPWPNLSPQRNLGTQQLNINQIRRQINENEEEQYGRNQHRHYFFRMRRNYSNQWNKKISTEPRKSFRHHTGKENRSNMQRNYRYHAYNWRKIEEFNVRIEAFPYCPTLLQ